MNRVRIFCGLVFLFSFVYCSKGKESSNVVKRKSAFSSISTFIIGSVEINQKPAKSGDVVEGDQTIRVGGGSLADIQIRGFQSQVTFRAKTQSELNVYSRIKDDKRTLIVFLKKGDLLFSVKKLQKDETVLIFTPSMKAMVVGTQFKIVVKEDATTNIKVADGSVDVRPSVPTLELLLNSEETDANTKEKINAAFGQGQVLDSGKETSVSNGKIKEALKDPELLKLLESPELKNIKTPTEPAENAELKKQLAELESKLPESIAAGEIKTSQGLAGNALKDLQKESSEIVSVADNNQKTGQELKKEIDSALKENNAVLLSTMGKVLGKGAETLVLKNGQNVTGIVYQTGSNYVVKTPQGELNFSESQVSGLRF
ncbi:hypothetical protein CH370_06105 [Leptospira kmetyi]|nr:hypothetical protein CH370_06105 [Leptospira kmetyi]